MSAIAIFEPLLSDRERILGPDHPHTLTTRHNVAGAYQAAGRVADAIAIYEPLLSDYERVLGPDYPPHAHHPPQSRRRPPRREALS